MKDPILWLFCRYKVAVAMPNLDELLKGTPVRRFASVWHKWRNIPLYPIHYSELIRLAALYKYVLFLQIIHIGFSSLTVVTYTSYGLHCLSGIFPLIQIWRCLS